MPGSVGRPAAWLIAVATTAVAMAISFAAITETAGGERGIDRSGLLQIGVERQQRLMQLDGITGNEGQDEEQPLDGGFEMDYGKESGVSEAMAGAKDDLMNIQMMKGQDELPAGDPNKEKLERLERRMARFEKKEADFLKVVDHPAQVTLSVTKGLPGKQGKRGARGQAGGQGAPGAPGIRGITGAL
jgi:hypothetical protein